MKNLKIVTLFMFAVASMHAQDLMPNEVPENLQSDFDTKFSNAQDVEWEKKGDHYKVEFEINRMDHDVWYDGQGNILKSKIEISLSRLPVVIASAVKTKYADYKIDSIKVLEEAGVKTYAIEIEKGWLKERQLVVDATGTIISDLED